MSLHDQVLIDKNPARINIITAVKGYVVWQLTGDCHGSDFSELYGICYKGEGGGKLRGVLWFRGSRLWILYRFFVGHIPDVFCRLRGSDQDLGVSLGFWEGFGVVEGSGSSGCDSVVT